MGAANIRAVRAGFRRGPLPAGPEAPSRARLTPFPALVFDWQEIFPFQFTIVLNAAESHTSRRLHGPLRITQVIGSVNAGNFHLYRFGVSLDDDDSEPTALANAAAQLPGQFLGDTLAAHNALAFDSEPTAFPLNITRRGGTSRVRITAHNDSASSIIIVGAITIDHLKPAHCACTG